MVHRRLVRDLVSGSIVLAPSGRQDNRRAALESSGRLIPRRRRLDKSPPGLTGFVPALKAGPGREGSVGSSWPLGSDRSGVQALHGFWRSYVRVGFAILAVESLAVLAYLVGTAHGPHRPALLVIASTCLAGAGAGLVLPSWVAGRVWRIGFLAVVIAHRGPGRDLVRASRRWPGQPAAALGCRSGDELP